MIYFAMILINFICITLLAITNEIYPQESIIQQHNTRRPLLLAFSSLLFIRQRCRSLFSELSFRSKYGPRRPIDQDSQDAIKARTASMPTTENRTRQPVGQDIILLVV